MDAHEAAKAAARQAVGVREVARANLVALVSNGLPNKQPQESLGSYVERARLYASKLVALEQKSTPLPVHEQKRQEEEDEQEEQEEDDELLAIMQDIRVLAEDGILVIPTRHALDDWCKNSSAVACMVAQLGQVQYQTMKLTRDVRFSLGGYKFNSLDEICMDDYGAIEFTTMKKPLSEYVCESSKEDWTQFSNLRAVRVSQESDWEAWGDEQNRLLDNGHFYDLDVLKDFASYDEGVPRGHAPVSGFEVWVVRKASNT